MDGADGAPPPYYPRDGARNAMFSAAPSSAASESTPALFPQLAGGPAAAAAAASAPAPAETVRRRRGRPRKYGASPFPSPPSLASSLNKASPSLQLPSSSPSPPPSSWSKKESLSSSSAKKVQLAALGKAGQGFTPHIITIASGEDVVQKIISFVQEHKRAFCILSASGSISSASLIQPAFSGGCIKYEGKFEIMSLSGSFLHAETGGASSRTGGLSICLSGANGHVVGGGVGGPLLAAGPVQVIAGSFLIDTEKEINAAKTEDNSASKLSIPTQGGTTVVMPINFKSTEESSLRSTTTRGSDDHRNVGVSGSNYMLQYEALHMRPPQSSTEWRGR